MSKARELAELGAVYDSGALSNRNLIINGAMQVAQRGTSSTSYDYNTVDRFKIANGSVGTMTTTQESTSGVDGVSKYSLKVAATDTASLAAGSDAWIRYVVETKDIENLDLTNSDKYFTLSFYVKCNTTGQSSVAITAGLFSAANYVSKYTIAAADTWQKVEVTFPGNSNLATVSGDLGLRIYWDLGGGTSYQTTSYDQWITTGDYAAQGNIQIVGVNGNYLQITGVQLEDGPDATPFEHRSYGDELARCQRYHYQTNVVNNGHQLVRYSTNQRGRFYFPVVMRAAPTVSFAGTSIAIYGGNTSEVQALSDITATDSQISGFRVQVENVALTEAATYINNLKFIATAEI